MIDKKYIINIKGKDFVKYAGLLNEAHNQGLYELSVKDIIVNWEKKSAYCVVEAKIKVDSVVKVVEGVGSGTQDNCGDMVKEHFIEMAHTRAKARALRDIVNVDMVAVDELKDLKEAPKASTFGKDVKVPNKCADCDKDISDAEKEFSIKYHSKTLCRECQKKNKKN